MSGTDSFWGPPAQNWAYARNGVVMLRVQGTEYVLSQVDADALRDRLIEAANNARWQKVYGDLGISTAKDETHAT